MEITLREEQSLGGQMAVNAILDARALADEERAAAEQLATPTGLEIRYPNRRQEVRAQQFRELAASMMSVLERACQMSFTWYASATCAVSPVSCNRATSHSQYSVASMAITTDPGNAASQASTVSIVVASWRISLTMPPLASSAHAVMYHLWASPYVRVWRKPK